MLDSIRRFFNAQMQPDAAGHLPARALQIATAALLIEMTRMDERISPEEQAAVIRALQGKFGLAAAECEQIIALAAEEAAGSISYYDFTSLINEHFTQQQKILVIEYLWEVAYADSELDIYEEHLVRKLAELLHVPHREFMAAKHRVQARSGQG